MDYIWLWRFHLHFEYFIVSSVVFLCGSYSSSPVSSSSSKVRISIELSEDSFEPGLWRLMSIVPIDSLDEESKTSKLREHMQFSMSHSVAHCSSSYVDSNGIMAAIMFSGPIASECPTEVLPSRCSFSASFLLVSDDSSVGGLGLDQYEHRWSLHGFTSTSVTAAAAADWFMCCKYWQRNISSPTWQRSPKYTGNE